MTNPRKSVSHLGRGAPCPMRRQGGLTLVELMIALGLGLLLVAGVGAVYLGSNQTYRVAQDSARIQEAGRYALDVIGRSLRQAGYLGVSAPKACDEDSSAPKCVRGVNAICPTASPDSDIVTVQYDGVAGEQDCQADNIVAGDLVQHTFFIRDAVLRCDAVRNATPPTPPTTCPGEVGDQLLENIEDLQIVYGIDTDTTPDQSADCYDVPPWNNCTLATWAKVVSVRVCVLVRSENEGVAPANSAYFNCDGALGTAADDAARFSVHSDTRLRRAFVATFTLRNRITRIPSS